MRQIRIETLTRDAFAPFGLFYDMENPDGFAFTGEIHSFFPDRISADSLHRVGFSSILVKKPEKMIVTQQECHTGTWEMSMPLNDDMIIHAAPASGAAPVTELTRCFLVPRHTLVKLNAAVWHLAPLPAHEKQLAALIILPECTYANDCTTVTLTPQQQFEIVW